MDEQTALVLAIQLVALFSIAGALLLYLICKIRVGFGSEPQELSPGAGKPVLVTCCDNAVGLQIAIHLANRGFRVFAGLKDISTGEESPDTTSSRIIRSWQKHRESISGHQGALVALPLDVTREDLLHEAVDIIRAHLPAGKDGIWAVINTSGSVYRGRFDQQDITHWDAVLKTNVVGVLRTARTFQNLLKTASGRIVTIGAVNPTDSGLVAYTAARYGVEGASKALRTELAPLGIKVITLNPTGLSTDSMFVTPKFVSKENTTEISVESNGCLEYYPLVLSESALCTLDVAITVQKPKMSYDLVKNSFWRTLSI
nr:D-beta-hydroxybutyrate dehydrogenase, mitochondrial [Onthophagus taurus]